MPVSYRYSLDRTEIRCSHCGRVRVANGRENTESALDIQGSPITDFIRFLPARGVFHSWCRDCERAARRAQPRRPRVAPTTMPDGTQARRLAARKFGVELEMKFPRTVGRERISAALHAAGLSSWRVKSDGSLSSGNGWEIVSPPLSDEAGFEQLRTATRVLREIGGTTDRQCGTHVHHDISDLSIDQVKRFVASWSGNQRLIDGLVSPSRRGESQPTYCKPLGSDDLNRVNRLTSLQGLRSVSLSRYKTLNLTSYGRYGTAEIRQHQGTGDYEKIRSWVLFAQALIDTSKAAPVTPKRTVRGLLDAFGDLMDETAKTFCLGRALQFGYAPVTEAAGAVA